MAAGRFCAALVLSAALVAASCGDEGAASQSARDLAHAAADRFLDRYVAGDGRVVRRDEQGDTVSEGQAYAMLLSAASGDERRFDRVWSWTRSHLQRRDGLLSWLWRDGRVADPQAATDADLDAAHALVLAARRFHRPALRRDGRRIAHAVLTHETASAASGRRVLVAGPWAVKGRVINPSYFAPRAYAELATTGRRVAWRDLRDQAVRATRSLTRAARLPPDWARAKPGTRVRAIARPAGGDAEPPRYGFDAVRVPIRMGSACDSASRRLAAGLWPVLERDSALLPRRLDGTPADSAVRHAVALVGAAGAARAAGEPGAVRRLLDQAAAQDRAAPTYYGAAWVALGRVFLTTPMAGGCARSRSGRAPAARQP